MAKGKIFQKPAGSSRRIWNNESWSSDGDVLCEVCGTAAPEGESSIVDRFLGLQLVEKCCGKLIDRLFEEFDQVFCLAFLEDFVEGPTNSRFDILKMILKEMPEKLRAKAQETTKIAEVVEQITDEAE